MQATHEARDLIPEGFDDAVRTLANRLARRRLLCRLPAGHPVLVNEEDLVEMAKSRLQELMMCHPGRARHSTRLLVERSIREAAVERAMRADSDYEDRADVVRDIMSMDLSDLFPVLN